MNVKMRKYSFITGLIVCLLLFIVTGCGSQQNAKTNNPPQPAVKDLILATTTSTQDSGLLDVLIPAFEQNTGYKVKVIAVGTGKALEMGKKGEADVLLVHAPDAEKALIEDKSAINRRLIMHNDFILVGPANDPAQVKGKTVGEALANISKEHAIFVSRGDDSGTHKMELQLWKQINIKPEGSWYQQVGAGMGQTLKVADEKQGYTLTDRATYLSLKKTLSLEILVEGDAKLLNIYHVMEVNPEKYSKVNSAGAKAFSDFLLSEQGQSMIAAFGQDKFGTSLFFKDGDKTDKDLGL